MAYTPAFTAQTENEQSNLADLAARPFSVDWNMKNFYIESAWKR
jgi:hypothetical protein